MAASSVIGLADRAYAATPSPQHHLKVIVHSGYLPQVPVLVRVELRKTNGERDREVWNADAVLSETVSGVTLSTNRITLANGLGTRLVAVSGSGDFDLQVSVGTVQTNILIRDLSAEALTRVGGTLTGTATTWSGVVNVTNDVTIPSGHTLTIQSNTLVLINGVSSGTTAPDLLINGSIQSLGTAEHPVTITCANGGQRWGQIRHTSAQPSLYRYTAITRAGRAQGEGHTGQAPAVRPTNSRIVFESCTISDHAERTSGTPGKIMQASGSDLIFNDCVLARARMGPEIASTAIVFTNGYILEMYGPDDADGIYIHTQSAGQPARLLGSVVGIGEDDGIDTLGSTVDVENCIIRDWASRVEDAKGISVFNGATRVRRCLIVDCTVGIAAKWNSGPSTLVTIDNSTLTDNLTNVWANWKDNARGPNIDFRITNSILWTGDPIQSDFGTTNFTIGYCILGEAWAGTNNLVADALFVNATNHDYHLRSGSPAIDGGNPLSPPDPDGSRIDIGYFTFEAPPPMLSAAQPLPGGGVRFELSAYTNRNYAIEVSTNLSTWGTLTTVHLTNEPRVVTDSATDQMRLYRARLTP